MGILGVERRRGSCEVGAGVLCGRRIIYFPFYPTSAIASSAFNYAIPKAGAASQACPLGRIDMIRPFVRK